MGSRVGVKAGHERRPPDFQLKITKQIEKST